jgi:serine/threonine-protein kinase
MSVARGRIKPGDLIAEKYVVTRLLGEGGMGQVFAATHVDLRQEVAIKIMIPERMELGSESVDRFLHEARTISLLKSSHVPRVFDLGKTAAGLPYIVMELLSGQDLVDVLSCGPLPCGEAVNAILQACDAVGEAHSHGIIHRDLKPENLFLTRRRDGTPCVKVLDFGISKMRAEQGDDKKRGRVVTKENTILGSPSYMSPEQTRRSNDVDGRSDIWSLGVTLYELLTQRDPFAAETTPETFVKVLTYNPPSPTELRPEIPTELSAVVMRCLEKDPASRFQDVNALATALLSFTTRTATSIAPSWGQEAAPLSLSLPILDQRLAQLESAAMSTPNPVAVTLAHPRVTPQRRRVALIAATFGVLGITGVLLAIWSWSARAKVAAAAGPAPAESSVALVTTASPPSASAATSAAPSAAPPPSAASAGSAKSQRAGPSRFAPRTPLTKPQGTAAPKVTPSSLPRVRTSW